MTDAPQQPHFANIDIDSYQEHFHSGDHTLVDVRRLDEWTMGHLPGAIHIPMDELPDRLNEIPNDKPVVMVCATGNRSLRTSQFLIGSGFMEVYNLSDGTKGWAMRGLPLER